MALPLAICRAVLRYFELDDSAGPAPSSAAASAAESRLSSPTNPRNIASAVATAVCWPANWDIGENSMHI